jgi:hypothetical protein
MKLGGSMIKDVYSETPPTNNEEEYGEGYNINENEMEKEIIKNTNLFGGGRFTFADDLSTRFEGGTAPISQAIGLKAASNFLTNTVGFNNLQNHQEKLTYKLHKKFIIIKGLTVYGPPLCTPRGPLLTFHNLWYPPLRFNEPTLRSRDVLVEKG